MVTSVKVKVVGPHPSLEVGEENDGVAGQIIVALAPTPVMIGSVLSSTVMVCEAVVVLPH